MCPISNGIRYISPLYSWNCLALDQLGCWKSYPRRTVYVKQLAIPLVLWKAIKTPQNKTAQILLQPKFTAMSYYTMSDLKDQ